MIIFKRHHSVEDRLKEFVVFLEGSKVVYPTILSAPDQVAYIVFLIESTIENHSFKPT